MIVAPRDHAREACAGMRPEREILIRCAGHALLGEGRDSLREIAAGPLNWRRVIALCEWHGIVPQVYRSLQGACPDAVPGAALADLRGLYHANSARALFLASELSRILAAFEKRGVPAYPFKGPALAVMLYGDPAGRQSVDLDILIPRDALRDAMGVLAALGYGKGIALEGARLSAHRRTQCELQFHRNDGKLLVELQWAVVPSYFGFCEEELKIWEKRRAMRCNGYSFPALPPEETLVALCVHGAKHLWCKMGWICDVAALAAGPVPLDWERLTALAGRCRVHRILLLGLHLARELAGASLPEAISAKIAGDPMIGRLARQVTAEVPDKSIGHDTGHRKYFFYVKAKERREDQLRFAWRLLATLAAGEWNPSPLPDSLFPLYYVCRPLVLGHRYGLKALKERGSRGTAKEGSLHAAGT